MSLRLDFYVMEKRTVLMVPMRTTVQRLEVKLFNQQHTVQDSFVAFLASAYLSSTFATNMSTARIKRTSCVALLILIFVRKAQNVYQSRIYVTVMLTVRMVKMSRVAISLQLWYVLYSKA